ncbi:hypothetical protein Dimus_014033, partial [Dionaea muscipula]
VFWWSHRVCCRPAMADHAAIGGCGVVLPDLGLDLIPISEKRCWADGASAGDGVLTGALALEIEEGEILTSPTPGGPLAIGRGELSSGVDCRVMEVSREAVEDDLALNDLVDSVPKVDAPPSPSSPPWSESFANNGKPRAAHKSSKVDFVIPRSPNGSPDLSNGFDLGIFAEDPHLFDWIPSWSTP